MMVSEAPAKMKDRSRVVSRAIFSAGESWAVKRLRVFLKKDFMRFCFGGRVCSMVLWLLLCWFLIYFAIMFAY